MPFKVILKELVESTHGASGAILADWEGEAVEQYCLTDTFHLKVTAAHKGIIVNLLQEVLVNSRAGQLRDVIIATESQYVIVGAVGSDYSLAMTLGRNTLIGVVLRKFNSTVLLLEKEIY